MRIEYGAAARTDIERLTKFLQESGADSARTTAALIVEAVSLLGRHPNIGRTAGNGLRELVISRGRSGYVALYKVDILNDRVLLLALRHQRERDFLPS